MPSRSDKELEEKLTIMTSKVESLEERLALLNWQLANERKLAEEREQQLVEVAANSEQYARRIDELIKEMEVAQYLVRKAGEELLEEKDARRREVEGWHS